MNAGELKHIVEDFVQVRDAIRKVIDTGNFSNPKDTTNDEVIAGQIIAGKIAHGDYKGKGYYDELDDDEEDN